MSGIRGKALRPTGRFCALACAVVFVHAFTLRPVLNPDCIGHSAAPASYAEAAASDASGEAHGHDQDGGSADHHGQMEICLCKFGGRSAPTIGLLPGAHEDPGIVVRTGPSDLTVVAESYLQPPAIGPPLLA